MTDFSDLRLDRAESPKTPDEQQGPQLPLVMTIVAVLIAGAALGFFWLRRSHAPAPSTAPAAAAQPTQATSSTLKADPPLDVTVPPLDESDALVRQLVSALSTRPTVMAWLATNGLIRNFTLVVTNIAGGQTATKFLTMLRPKGSFAVVMNNGKTYIDPASYHRYDAYADAFNAIDATGGARLYATLKPRIADAYRDLGYPDQDFDATLKKAIVELLATPVIDAPIPVTHTKVLYAFEDPALEGLTGPQRQLLRMGPRNVRLVQQKLREIAPHLGIQL
jgi:hypothetical protein